MKRKYFAIIIAVLLIFLLAGCGKGNDSGGDTGAEVKDTLSGSVAGILSDVLANADAELPMMFDDAVTTETTQGMLGLTPDQFEQYVLEATASTAAISTFAVQFALVKCNDIQGATEVKSLIAKGFDSAKWICVMPEKSVTVESGSYVLLAAGPADVVDAVLKSFSDAANGNVGSPDIFFSV